MLARNDKEASYLLGVGFGLPLSYYLYDRFATLYKGLLATRPYLQRGLSTPLVITKLSLDMENFCFSIDYTLDLRLSYKHE